MVRKKDFLQKAAFREIHAAQLWRYRERCAIPCLSQKNGRKKCWRKPVPLFSRMRSTIMCTTKFVSNKEIKSLMATESWKDNWDNLPAYFKYPEAVRRLSYTMDAIEGFNCQLRKVTKSKTVFPSDDSLLKMLYLVMTDITKWTGHQQDWGADSFPADYNTTLGRTEKFGSAQSN